jgi:hypothetical protein
MPSDFLLAYQVVKEKRKEQMEIEKTEKKEAPVGLLKKIFFSKKYNINLVDRLTRKELQVDQMKQIRRAISLGLPERQINSLVNCNKDADAMSTIVDIAVTLMKKNKEAKG